jgi:phosphotransferase system HPr-like phosphotransfer protein
MKTVKVRLFTIKDVGNFVDAVRKYDAEIDLASGRYVVDAKSIMGIFSLDLANPITMTIHKDECDDIINDLKAFIVD